MRRIRWLSVVVPIVAVAIIELVSDGLLDAELPYPLDTVVVVIVVAVLAWGLSTIAFRRIDELSDTLRARNLGLERRAASARALHRVSVAIAALADVDEILRAVVEQARAAARTAFCAVPVFPPILSSRGNATFAAVPPSLTTPHIA